jgi:RHS repeat-associated protein
MSRIIKRIIFITFSLLICFNLKAQLPIVNQDSLKIPKLRTESRTKAGGSTSSSGGIAPVSMPIMPSANASSLVRAATASPNLYTGAVNVSIPLFTLPAQGMSVPIGLVYQSNGVKVNDRNGPLGMTWNLQGGGAVARIVRGYPDEFKGEITKKENDDTEKLKVSGAFHCPAFYDILNEIVDEKADGFDYDLAEIEAFDKYVKKINKKDEVFDKYHDLFIFSAPGLSGKFKINRWEDSGVVNLSESEYKITFRESKPFKAIYITTKNGTVYEFGANQNSREKQTFVTRTRKIVTENDIVDEGYKLEANLKSNDDIMESLEEGSTYESVWYLNQIILPFNAGTINYEYKEMPTETVLQAKSVNFVMESSSIIDVRDNTIFVANNHEKLSQTYEFSSTSTTTYAPKQLSSITTSYQKLNFEYTKSNIISSISVNDKDDNLIKNYNFRYQEVSSKIKEPSSTLTFGKTKVNVFPGRRSIWRGGSNNTSRHKKANSTEKGSRTGGGVSRGVIEPKRYFLKEISENDASGMNSIKLHSFEYNKPDFLPEFCSNYSNSFGYYRPYTNFKENLVKEGLLRYSEDTYKAISLNGSEPKWRNNPSYPEIGIIASHKTVTGATTYFNYLSKPEGAFLTSKSLIDGKDTLSIDFVKYDFETAQIPSGVYSFLYYQGDEIIGLDIWCGAEAAFTQGSYLEFRKVKTRNKLGSTEYVFTSPFMSDGKHYNNGLPKVWYIDESSGKFVRRRRKVGMLVNNINLRGKPMTITNYNSKGSLIKKIEYVYEEEDIYGKTCTYLTWNKWDYDKKVYLVEEDFNNHILRPTEIKTTGIIDSDRSQSIRYKKEFLKYHDIFFSKATEIRSTNENTADTILSLSHIKKVIGKKYQDYYTIGKTELFKNGNQISGQEFIFEDSKQLPTERKVYVNGAYEIAQYYDEFDDKGRILQTHGRDGINTSYRYKEGRVELIAMNASYDDIATGKVDDLRKKLPNAYISSAEYSDESFLSGKTDANGLSLYYDYDGFGRLKLVSDFDKNALKAYEYQYGKVGKKVTEKKLGIGEMQIGISFVVGGYIERTSEGMSTKGKNYISSYTFRKEGALFQERNKSEKAFKSIEYQDGLGRTTQQIALKTLPGEYSIVKGFVYDSLGRQSTRFRALPMLTNGAYKDLWETYLKSAYRSSYKSESLYDDYNRLSKQGSFGEKYALNAHASNYSYGMNKSGIPSYSIKQDSVEFKAKTYASGTLFKNSVYFEGITNVSYKNMDGQVVRKAAVKGDVTTDPTYENALITDYVYDDYGNLRAILPPQAKGDINQEELVYQFHYDGRGRLVKKKIPGAGFIVLKYDDLDRPINETDALGNTTYVKYDEFSRPIETGLRKGTVDIPLQKSHYDNYDFEFAKAYSSSFKNAKKNKGRSTGSETKVLGEDVWIKSVNYYDKRGRLIEVISQNNTGGIDKIKNSYDFEGKILSSVLTKNYKGKEWIVKREYAYGKTGELLDVSHKVNKERKVILNSFKYKPDGALSEKRVHNGKIKTRYEYDELDRMVKVATEKHFELELAFDSNLEGTQNTPYYDGSLSAMAWKTSGKERMTYSFDYDDYKNLKAANSSDHKYTTAYTYNKNGNMETLERKDSLGLFQNFTYKYKGNQLDSLQRHNTEQVEVWPGDTNNDAKVDVEDLQDVGYYWHMKVRPRDKRSDEWMAWWVKRRKGDETVFSDSNGDGFINEQDSVAIRRNLLESHPIAKINTNNTYGYSYDANGNMIWDEYKNIDIHYNHLNLPDTITAHGQGKIINVYLADGSLIQRKVIVLEKDKDGYLVEKEKEWLDYQGEFLFQNDTLSKIITEEGYASPSKKNKKKLTYFYVVSDHLGHSRVVLDEKENVVQTTAYYPYGLPITDLSSETKYNYLYTGKEFIGEFGLNWYDHHARQYDAEIGRWSAIDPSLQAVSPYMAMGNNPMMYVDADGRTWFKKVGNFLKKGWDGFWDAGNQFARWADSNGVPSAGAGYNSAQGTYHYMGDSGNVYHNQYGNNYEGKVDQAVFDARGDYFSQQANNASYDQMVMSNIMPVTSSSGGSGWEAYAGTAGSIGSEMFYSKTYGTWMGKNFKMYKQTWGGNGFTGGKNKFGKTTSNAIKWGGRVLGAWNAYSIQRDYAAGEIGTGWMLAEQGTNGVSVFGGVFGAAWGVGWELGRAVTTLDAYQEFKFNFWYNHWESQVGAPSQSNEGPWYYFYQNYGK